jgi:negative regulator of flagellin synthesis FlgM
MKVTNGGPKPTSLSNVATTGTTDAAKAKSNKAAGSTVDAEMIAGSAKVDVSARAQEMQKAKALATPSSGIDEAKVARLQSLIDKGQYKIDSSAIADRLVDEHLKMNE